MAAKSSPDPVVAKSSPDPAAEWNATNATATNDHDPEEEAATAAGWNAHGPAVEEVVAIDATNAPDPAAVAADETDPVAEEIAPDHADAENPPGEDHLRPDTVEENAPDLAAEEAAAADTDPATAAAWVASGRAKSRG